MRIELGTDPTQPNYSRAEHGAMLPDLKLLANLLGGTRAMHAASAGYIRKWKAERQDNYDVRRTCETVFEGLGQTLSAAVGMAFSTPPQMEWHHSEAAIKPHADNIDNQGTAFAVFAKRFGEAALRDGLAGILVDHTPPPVDASGAPRIPTAEEEATLNLRPVWTRYDRSQIINWQTGISDNQTVLTLVVLHEVAEEPSGPFGAHRVDKFRELRLAEGIAVWRLWKLVKSEDGKEEFEVEKVGVFTDKAGRTATRIPFAIAYAGRSDGVMDATIPLSGVAWANLSHWQLSTDLRFNTSVAAFAQPTVIGDLAKDPVTGLPRSLEIGPLVAVHLAEGGQFLWTEASGTGLERLAQLRDEKLQQMGTLGMNFLVPDTRAAETAEAKRIDATAQNANLATASQGIEDALNLAWEIHAWYMGIDRENAPVATLSRDFESSAIAANIMTAYVQAVAQAGLPPRILLEAWQQGGRIAQDVDLALLEMEMLAGQAAEAERQRAEAEARAEALQIQPAPDVPPMAEAA